MNSLDPTFVKPFMVNYHFEKNQIIKVEVYDYDDITAHDLIGNYECHLNTLLTAKNQTLKGNLTLATKTNARGRIII